MTDSSRISVEQGRTTPQEIIGAEGCDALYEFGTVGKDTKGDNDGNTWDGGIGKYWIL